MFQQTCKMSLQRRVYTYEELPLPSQWLLSPRTKYHSAKYTGNQVSIHPWYSLTTLCTHTKAVLQLLPCSHR